MQVGFLLCNENLNGFLTRVRKLFKGGNYSREETIYHIFLSSMSTKNALTLQTFLIVPSNLHTRNIDYG